MKTAYFPLVLILLIYAGVASLFATRIPAWQVPDEPAHYNYVRQLAQTGQFPVLEPSDWNANFSAPGPEQRNVAYETLTYEDHQPPLFYVLAAPVFNLTGGSLTALRLWSVFISLFSLIFAYLAVQTIFPTQAWIAPFVTAFMAFLPQRVHMMAGFNNDSLSEALITLVVLLCVRLILYSKNLDTKDSATKTPVSLLIALGVVSGLGLLTKAQAYLVLPLIVIALWMARTRIAIIGVPALAMLIGLPWWLRNIGLYGGTDFLGLQRHDVVVAGQLTSAQLIAKVGLGAYLRELLQTTFQSFWGQFGWMSIPIDRRLYILLLAFTLLSAVLFMVWWVAVRRPTTDDKPLPIVQRLSSAQSSSLSLLACLTLGAVLAFVWYNTKFVQFQGRYLYPGLIGIALMFALGWQHALSRWPTIQRWLWLPFALVFASFDAYLLLRVILRAMQA